MIFINKLDKERSSYQRTLDGLQERFGAGIAPLELRSARRPCSTGVADLLTDRAYFYDSGKGVEEDVPPEMEEFEHRIHDDLIEGIVVADDELLEGYLEGVIPSFERLEKTMAVGVADATVFPVVCGSATGPIAVDRLANFIVEIGPSAAQRNTSTVVAGDQEVDVDGTPEGEPLLFVFKTVADPYVGQISIFKVLSGTVKPDAILYNPRSGADERFHKIGYLVGKESEVIDAVPAGDIGAVSKLHDTATGDTLGPKAKPVRVGGIERPVPVLATAIEAANQADEDKLATSLRRLQEEDPALVITRSDETHQTLLHGMGETHLAITIEKLKRKFGVEVVTEEVQVPYRETVTRPSKAEGKYKKQTGGRGQFGVAMLEVEPLPRGPGSSSSTPSRAVPSPANSSRQWRPGSGTRCGTAGSTDCPSSTSGSAASTASTTRSTRRRCPSGWRGGSDSSRPWPTPVRSSSSRSRGSRSPCRPTTRAT